MFAKRHRHKAGHTQTTVGFSPSACVVLGIHPVHRRERDGGRRRKHSSAALQHGTYVAQTEWETEQTRLLASRQRAPTPTPPLPLVYTVAVAWQWRRGSEDVLNCAVSGQDTSVSMTVCQHDRSMPVWQDQSLCASSRPPATRNRQAFDFFVWPFPAVKYGRNGLPPPKCTIEIILHSGHSIAPTAGHH